MDIPKDGLWYNCWDSKDGHTKVRYCPAMKFYVLEFEDNWWTHGRNVVRWQDQFGNWHEVPHG